MSLVSLGYGPYFSAQLELLDRPDLVPARLLSEGRDVCHLGGTVAALGELSGKLRRELGPLDRPAVGDWVAVADDGHRAIIHRVLDRRSALLRRAAGSSGAGQVVAANVDLFFVVTSANLDFNPRRLERYLAAVWDSGASPVVVLNKIDLAGDLDALAAELEAVALGVPIARVSATTGAGLDELRAHLAPGLTIALIGSSGVGKSSIINRLLGDDSLAVQGLRNDDKGRHTTTRRELLLLPGGGILIDTPGMRELGLIEDAGGIDASFADIAELAAGCRFADCGHDAEPGCAVTAAIATGELPADRLASYRKLLREVAAAERLRDPAKARRSKQRWKAIHMAMRARKKVDPKLQR